MTLPHVGVMHDKYYAGLNNLSEAAVPLTVVPFEQAFGEPWPSDAHFVTYRPVGWGPEETQRWFRCNKALLPKVRTAAAGADLHTTMLALDYDNPNHEPWTREGLGRWLNRLAELADAWPLAWQWTLLYTTRHGARLIYVLSESLPVDEAEPKHRWLVNAFRERGILFDTACSDWTRVFRLPWVIRESGPTWEDEGEHLLQADNRLDPEELPNLERQRVNDYAEVREFDEPKPTADECRDLLETISTKTGQWVQSAWFKAAKKRLRGRECYDCVFEHVPIASQGARNDTIYRYVGQAVSLLYYLEGTTAAHVYALFLPSVEQLEPDAETPDWTETLWDHVGRLWVLEEAKAEAAKKQQEQEQEEAEDLAHRVLDGMRQWCDSPQLKGDEEQAIQWMLRRLIVSIAGKGYAVMTPSGRYDALQVASSELVARIRILGMDRLIPTRQLKEDGSGYKDIDVRQILGEHATVVSGVRAVPNIPGAYVEHLDSDNATLVQPAFRRRTDLPARYNEQVDVWLWKLFGEQKEIVERWIAWALAFEEGPICALSVKGGQGVGKKMLVQGLAECLERPRLASADDLVGNFNYGLLESPFLLVNEGWPRDHTGRHPADQFRALVSGDDQYVNRKNLAPVKINNPARIIFTANNHDVVKVLCGNRDLSPEDREALAIRLLHIDVSDDAQLWLRQHGGMKFTGQPGQRWIRGDGNEPSDFIVASHFMWLYQHKRAGRGSRFLVEGNSRNDLIFEMRTSSGSAPLVIETVIHLIESKQRRDGLVIEDNRIFILVSEVLSYYRHNLAKSANQKLTSQMIANVFKGLTCEEDSPKPRTLEARKSLGRRRWYELDVELLLSVARRDGWTSPILQQCADGVHQEQTGVIARIGDPA